MDETWKSSNNQRIGFLEGLVPKKSKVSLTDKLRADLFRDVRGITHSNYLQNGIAIDHEYNVHSSDWMKDDLKESDCNFTRGGRSYTETLHGRIGAQAPYSQ